MRLSGRPCACRCPRASTPRTQAARSQPDSARPDRERPGGRDGRRGNRLPGRPTFARKTRRAARVYEREFAIGTLWVAAPAGLGLRLIPAASAIRRATTRCASCRHREFRGLCMSGGRRRARTARVVRRDRLARRRRRSSRSRTGQTSQTPRIRVAASTPLPPSAHRRLSRTETF